MSAFFCRCQLLYTDLYNYHCLDNTAIMNSFQCLVISLYAKTIASFCAEPYCLQYKCLQALHRNKNPIIVSDEINDFACAQPNIALNTESGKSIISKFINTLKVAIIFYKFFGSNITH